MLFLQSSIRLRLVSAPSLLACVISHSLNPLLVLTGGAMWILGCFAATSSSLLRSAACLLAPPSTHGLLLDSTVTSLAGPSALRALTSLPAAAPAPGVPGWGLLTGTRAEASSGSLRWRHGGSLAARVLSCTADCFGLTFRTSSARFVASLLLACSFFACSLQPRPQQSSAAPSGVSRGSVGWS